MINISGNVIKPDDFFSIHQLSDIEKQIVISMSTGIETYKFSSEGELIFELEMRKNIIDSALGLLKSRLRFRTFRESECNREFWERSEEGGFSLKAGIRPSDAISDIFINGRRYGTECATAIVIIYYKALLNIYNAELFDRLFNDIYLMNWQNESKHLGVRTYRGVKEFFPGDCRYFSNPDVNPLTPEWQGENVIDLNNGMYYGHGIGISNSDGIIAALNRNRISGSEVSAYLMDTATRPDFKKLYANLVQP